VSPCGHIADTRPSLSSHTIAGSSVAQYAHSCVGGFYFCFFAAHIQRNSRTVETIVGAKNVGLGRKRYRVCEPLENTKSFLKQLCGPKRLFYGKRRVGAHLDRGAKDDAANGDNYYSKNQQSQKPFNTLRAISTYIKTAVTSFI